MIESRNLAGTSDLTTRELYLMVAELEGSLLLRLNLEQRALELQAEKYESRLSELQKAIERSIEKENQFISRGFYDAQHTELEKRVELNTTALVSLTPVMTRVDSIFIWRDEVGRQLADLASVPSRLDELARGSAQHKTDTNNMDKKITQIWSYGTGAVAALTVLTVLTNLLLRFLPAHK